MVKAEGPDYVYVKVLQYTKNQPVCVFQRGHQAKLADGDI